MDVLLCAGLMERVWGRKRIEAIQYAFIIDFRPCKVKLSIDFLNSNYIFCISTCFLELQIRNYTFRITQLINPLTRIISLIV